MYDKYQKKSFPFAFVLSLNGPQNTCIECHKLMCFTVREKHLKGKMFIKQYQTVLLDETQFLDSS